jgi:glycosyltransferase involved in cell wall biosynthesis
VVFEGIEAGYVKLLVRPSDADVLALYSMADAFVFPSWYEGLGLPLLEAMHCGAPVIASDRGSIPEVAGPAALIADVDDIDQFAAYIQRVLTDKTEAERLRQLGYAHAAQFTWDKTAQRVLEIYEQTIGMPMQA